MTSRRERELEALHEVAVASSGLLDPIQLSKLVVERARDLLEGTDATLLMWDDSAGGLVTVADTHAPPFSRTVRAGEGAAGLAYQRGEAVAVEDYPRWAHAVPDSLPRGLKSVVATPLLVRTRTVGALTVSFNRPRRIGAEELRVLALLATQVAPALDAARLHDVLVNVSRRLEETNEALRQADRHKSVFLANMSHELRTPLNAIIGFSELLIDAQPGQFDDATRRRFLVQILAGGRHLLGLINDILDLSKVEAGRLELKLQTVGAAGVTDEVMRSVEPLAAKKNLVVKSSVAPGLEVLADPDRVKQMLLNLVSNAIKFTPAGGRVTITAARRGETIEISVADTGIGISASDQALLFREFQQIDQGPGRRQEGTGLGLALTRRLAALHGGDVRFWSEAGKGSVFTVVLPAKAPATHTDPVSGERTVLVVEDDTAAADLLTRQVEEAGYVARVVRTGPEAIEAAHRLRPAAITLDIILPDLDGWEVIARLKADQATSAIPIIVVSVVDERARGMALGAADYLVKPVAADALMRRLKSLSEESDLTVLLKRLAG